MIIEIIMNGFFTVVKWIISLFPEIDFSNFTTVSNFFLEITQILNFFLGTFTTTSLVLFVFSGIRASLIFSIFKFIRFLLPII